MSIYDWKFLASVARNCSPFYHDLYRDMAKDNFTLTDFPIVNPAAYQVAIDPRNNQVLTRPADNGIVINSGGSSGPPKLTIYSKEEWHTFGTITADLQQKYDILKNGTKILYMLAANNLYAGMTLGYEIQMQSTNNILMFLWGYPQNQHADHVNKVINLIETFNINTLIGPAQQLLMLIMAIKERQLNLNIDTILYAGNIVYYEQHEIVKSAFPQAFISGHLYASSDAGFIGFADRSCDINQFRTFNQYAYIEIVDEHGLPIKEENREGRIVSTNFTRLLMPIIRYTVGDLATWVEPYGALNRKLQLTGRILGKEAMIMLKNNYLIDYNVIKKIIDSSKFSADISFYQVIISSENNIEKFSLKFTTKTKDKTIQAQMTAEILAAIYQAYPELKTFIENKLIQPIEVTSILFENLEYLTVSGKLQRIVDLRPEK